MEALAEALAAVVAEEGADREDQEQEGDEPVGNGNGGVGHGAAAGSGEGEAEVEGGGEDPDLRHKARVLVGEAEGAGVDGPRAVGAMIDDSALAGEDAVGGVRGFVEERILVTRGAGPEGEDNDADEERKEWERPSESPFDAADR